MPEIDVPSRIELKALMRELFEEYIPTLKTNVKTAKSEPESKDDLITRKELLQRLHISPVKLWNMMRRDQIPYLKLGRKVFFRFEEVLKSMEKQA